jgi:hypothetical protein
MPAGAHGRGRFGQPDLGGGQAGVGHRVGRAFSLPAGARGKRASGGQAVGDVLPFIPLLRMKKQRPTARGPAPGLRGGAGAGKLGRGALRARRKEFPIRPRATPEDLAALARRAGLGMTPDEIAALHAGAWGHVERMLDRLDPASLDRLDEPAATFDPEAP